MATKRTLLKNGTVLSLDRNVGNHKQADVLIDGSKIAAVGPNLSAADAEAIDASNTVVMPGFIDTHRHVWEGILRTIKPSFYPIPDDGPVGRMLRAVGRHPYRPAHIHFRVSADGYVPLTTELYLEGDHYIDSDVVFGVRSSLIVNAERHDSPDEAAKYGVTAPFHILNYDFVLPPA
jgi:hypothetical protein